MQVLNGEGGRARVRKMWITVKVQSQLEIKHKITFNITKIFLISMPLNVFFFFFLPLIYREIYHQPLGQCGVSVEYSETGKK